MKLVEKTVLKYGAVAIAVLLLLAIKPALLALALVSGVGYVLLRLNVFGRVGYSVRVKFLAVISAMTLLFLFATLTSFGSMDSMHNQVHILQEMETFYRYLDVDGDGIPARTLPGVDPKGAYFTRGSGHDRFGRYTEDADLYKDVVDRIARKIEGAAEALPAAEIRLADEATVGLVTVGGCGAAVLEALELLAKEGITLDYLRVTGFPFSTAVEEFLLSHDLNIVIEQNRDGQLKRLLLLETAVPKSKLSSVLDYGGAPLNAHVVVEGVRDRLGLVPVEAG